MNSPLEGVCNHMGTEEICDCCSDKPATAGSSRSITGDNCSTKRGVTHHPNAEGGQSVEHMSTVGTASISYSQLDADTRKSMSSWLRYVDHSDWETDLSHGPITNCTPKYYPISSDGQGVHEDGGLESDRSDISAGEKRSPDRDSPGQRRKQQIPSLVSFFRLSSDSTSSTSSSDFDDYDCSPHTTADARPTDFPVFRTQVGPVRSEFAEGRTLAGARPMRTSRRMFSDKETAKVMPRRAKPRAPLARLLLTFSRACAETSVRLDMLVRDSALTEPGNPPKTQRDFVAETRLDAECTPMQQWPGFTAHQTKTQEIDTQSKSRLRAPEGEEGSEKRFHTRASPDSIKRFRCPPAYCPETVAESLIHCISFERKRPSRGLFQAIAGAGGQILASATALAARAAAAAAAAINSDTETEHGAGSFDESDEDIDEEEERFGFTFGTAPFQFVLWASKGSQSLLKSPLLTGPHVISSATPMLTADELEGDEASSSEHRQKQQQLYCLRAVALRLLLLICHDTPDWYADPPRGDADYTTSTTVSARANGDHTVSTTVFVMDTRSPDGDVEGKGRSNYLPHTTSHCSYFTAHEEGATGTVPEKGVFGYMVRKDVDLLWQRWKRVAAAECTTAQDKDAFALCDHEAARRDTPIYSRRDYENEITSEQAWYQSDDDLIWHAARRMLKVDAQLFRLWALKVPNFVSNEEFWKQYFYQVFQVMKRCERQVEPQWPFPAEADTQSKFDAPSWRIGRQQ